MKWYLIYHCIPDLFIIRFKQSQQKNMRWRITERNNLIPFFRIFLNDHLEEQMEELRLFKKLMVLRIAMSDNAETLPLMKISDSLTWLAEAIIRELIILAWKQTELKFGHP